MILVLSWVLIYFVMGQFPMDYFPHWFYPLFGMMAYTFVHFFANIIVNVRRAKAARKQMEKYHTGPYYGLNQPPPVYKPDTSTLEVQQQIEAYTGELRKAYILSNVDEKEMYKEFEAVFTDFSDKSKAANDKYTKQNHNP